MLSGRPGIGIYGQDSLDRGCAAALQSKGVDVELAADLEPGPLLIPAREPHRSRSLLVGLARGRPKSDVARRGLRGNGKARGRPRPANAGTIGQVLPDVEAVVQERIAGKIFH